MMSKLVRVSVAALLPMLLAACGPSTPSPNGPDTEEGPPAPKSALEQGVGLIDQERFDEALTPLQRAVSEQPNNARAHYYLAVATEMTGDVAGAKTHYEKALELDPKLAEAAVNLAAMALEEPADPDRAIALLTSALEQTPEHPEALANLAYAHGLKGDIDQAIAAYEKSIAAGDTLGARYSLGVLLFENERPEEAAKHLKKVIEGKPDDHELLASVGLMMGFAKAFGECVAAFDQAIAIEAGIAELYVRRGTCRHELKDEKGAQADYRKAIEVDPGFAAAHYYLGLSLLSEGDKAGAKAALEQAKETGKGTKIGELATKRLGAL